MGSKSQEMTINMCALTDAQLNEKQAIEVLDHLLSEENPEVMAGFKESLEQVIPQIKEQLKDKSAFNEETVAELRRIFSSRQTLLAARLTINVMVGVVACAMEEIGGQSENGDFEEEEV